MSYRCEKCNIVAANGVNQVKVTTETREKITSYGEVRLEIAREAVLCSTCRKEREGG